VARFFIRRPVFAVVLSVIIVLLGVLAIVTLPISQFPPISPPLVQVQATYVGASATVVEQSVATAIEKQVNGAENMIYMQSTSTSQGLYTLNCTFAVGTDLQKSAIDVQNRVQQATGSLPASVVSYGITVKKKSPQLLMIATLYAPGNAFDALFLSNYASIHVVDRLAAVDGVGDNVIVGKRDYAMRAWVRPDRLARLGLQASDLQSQIQDQNVQIPTGQIGNPPAQAGNQFQLTVNAAGQLDSPKAFGNIVVRTNPDGSILRLRDVARLELGAQSYSSVGRIDGQNATVILLYQAPDANAIATAKRVRAELAVLGKDFPPGMAYDVSYDSTIFVTDSIKDVIRTLIEAIVLVVIVVFVFLGSVKTSLIPMLAVPVSLIGTFALFVPLAFSINTLTLFGLVLAIGIVVDDAIVVVEAVEKHIEDGLSAPDATERAMRELTGPVIAIALVLTAVFLPSAFVGGITGQLYRQFALTLSVSVIISAIVALTLTPALCALILGKRTRLWGPFGWLIDRFNGGFARTSSAYMQALDVLVRRSVLVVCVLLLFYFADGVLAAKLPSSLVPNEDQGVFFVSVQLPLGSSLDVNNAVTTSIENDMKRLPGVKDVIALGGFNLINNTITPDSSSLVVTLEPWDDRKSKETGLRAILLRAYAKLNAYPQAVAFPFIPPTIPGLGNASGFNFELEDRAGHGTTELANVADKIVEAAATRPELTRVTNGLRSNVPQLALDVNRDKAKSLGVNVSEIFQNLQAYLGGLIVNDFTLYDRTWKVMIQAEPEFRATAANIGAIQVRNSAGDMVPLSTLVNIRSIVAPDQLQRFNVQREAEITGTAQNGYSSGQAVAAMTEVAKQNLPPGYAFEWAGTAYQEVQAGNTQALIFVLSIVLVFLVLAAQYESPLIPFAVLMGVPLGIFGAFASVVLWKLTSDVYVQIGLIMLIGLAAKNAILIVEVARERHEVDGLPILEAARVAAGLRFRPILMTSFAFIIGVIPLMLSTGAGAGSRHSLGSAVFGGMLAATVLGVFFIPSLYVLVAQLTERFGRRRRLVATAVAAAPPVTGTPASASTEGTA
jgi:hydrophobe/amphiphile efflux-1 (HAE1) family protein